MLLPALVVICFCSGARADGRDHNNVCERELIVASNRHGVPLGVLYAVGLVESGKDRSLHPFAVDVGGVAHYPASKAQALATVDQAQKSGATPIDIGCMQINLRFHRDRFTSLEEMFDPSKNVRYGAAYLAALHARTGNWTEAVARYHASPANRTAQATYVCAVIRNLVAEGLGAWTTSARTMCSAERTK
ncbi:MAG TPA: transglycosylase SLT domain-containing protein [Rhodoblastus sp.]|nr:transglycosylase SLT domain-containing protein [Rhodoblastus sp.]